MPLEDCTLLLQIESSTDENDKNLREFCRYLRDFVAKYEIIDDQNDYREAGDNEEEGDNYWATSEELFVNLMLEEMLGFRSIYSTLDFQANKTNLRVEHKSLVGNLGKVISQIRHLSPAIERLLPYNPDIESALSVMDAFHQDLIEAQEKIKTMPEMASAAKTKKQFCIYMAKHISGLFEQFDLPSASTVTQAGKTVVGSPVLEFLSNFGKACGLRKLSVSTWHGYLSDTKKSQP
ncbi:MAG: hypothetical protein KDI30_11905 [Pseudomonadales bacterium]|nr:hypothetical protein [Pseudomonadales bacterium]